MCGYKTTHFTIFKILQLTFILVLTFTTLSTLYMILKRIQILHNPNYLKVGQLIFSTFGDLNWKGVITWSFHHLPSSSDKMNSGWRRTQHVIRGKDWEKHHHFVVQGVLLECFYVQGKNWKYICTDLVHPKVFWITKHIVISSIKLS